MMDNEYERVEAGWLMDDRRSSKINHDQSDLDGKILILCFIYLHVYIW